MSGKKIKNSKLKLPVALLLTAVILGIAYYAVFPALTPISPGFWVFIAIAVGLFVVIYTVLCLLFDKVDIISNKKSQSLIIKIPVAIGVISIIILIIGGIISAPLFRSSTYAKVMKVQDSEFEKELPETENVSDIALMDSESAAIIGNRAMGELTNLVSQFEVSQVYSQIDYNGKPMKVAPLEYADFFKWFNNKNDGIPGYILVDPINNTAKYIETDKAINYSPSAYFNNNLYRHLQMKYPTKLFGNCYFEIDNEGNPFWICSVMKHEAGLFGAENVAGCVIMDACDGTCQYYDVEDVPTWVDIVYNGDLIQKQYNWYGNLSNGFINSVIGNKGCKVATDDYGYKVMDGDVWIYTGVTSVNGDRSNIGFILVNSRTGECKYFNVSGAEEHSAMAAAEGEVQNLGYDASFPSLINIAGQPTYIMVLKDNGGLVKQYALVNVSKYNVVATATTQKEVLKEYKKLLRENDLIDPQVAKNDQLFDEITVDDVQFVLVDDETIVYIRDGANNIYKQNFSENESLITIRQGDMIKVYYDEKSDITTITSFEKTIDYSDIN